VIIDFSSFKVVGTLYFDTLGHQSDSA